MAGAPFSSAVAKQVLTFFTNQNVILVSPSNEDYHLREKEILHPMEDALNYKAIAEKLYISYKTVRTDEYLAFIHP
jgi:DNA-binding NarL/FixJ family response regulator